MGNTSARQNTYQEYHRAIDNNNQNMQIKQNDNEILKKIDLSKLNHYEVLNVSKNFTWNELKDSYRKLAMNTHPDKPGGNKELFNIITYSFKVLANEYKNRNSNLDHHDLKKQ